ncbi:hypothetical protein [Streptomyces sp. NPDC057418]|uniref:hypothetical protein n=1 Tax=unclassified Streptomyces TaxID=2593676 RepID=UPI00369243CD
MFDEFYRTLAPGGHLLPGGHLGDEHLSPARSFGHPVSYRSYFLPLPRLAGLLRRSGPIVTVRMEQEPDGRVKRRSACLLARKPVRT